MTAFQVSAAYVSPISGADVHFELAECGRGFAFRNLTTGRVEMGTYTEAANRFEALDKFRHIFGEMKPRFELN